jgi:hypothetical protein
MTFKHLFLLLPALAMIAPARAQSPDRTDKAPIEFRVIGWNRDIPDMFYELKGKPQPLPLRRGTLSQPQRYVGEPTMVFYVPAVVDGETVRQPVVQVALKPPPQKNLVIVWLAKSGRYEAAVLSDDADKPMPGQLRFVNVSNLELVVKCNAEAPFTLPARGEKIVGSEAGGVGVRVAMRTNKNGSWELALMNGIAVEPNERVTAFIVDPSQLALAPEEEGLRGGGDNKILSLFLIRDRVEAGQAGTDSNTFGTH